MRRTYLLGLALVLGGGFFGAKALAASPPAEASLPVDQELFGAWGRDRAPGLPAEAVHYDKTGRYLRVSEGGQVEHGIWVALVRGDLRWLRRCPILGGAISPKDCAYFGRYRIDKNVMLEELACPDAWEGSLTRNLPFGKASERCASPSRRFADTANRGPLEQELQGIQSRSTKIVSVEPAAKGTQAGTGTVSGVWLGKLGHGPEQVQLVFSAMSEGAFYYSLEAAGQKETSSGTWDTDGNILILKHPDGEVEKIPYAIRDDILEWSDSEVGTLELRRQS